MSKIGLIFTASFIIVVSIIIVTYLFIIEGRVSAATSDACEKYGISAVSGLNDDVNNTLVWSGYMSWDSSQHGYRSHGESSGFLINIFATRKEDKIELICISKYDLSSWLPYFDRQSTAIVARSTLTITATGTPTSLSTSKSFPTSTSTLSKINTATPTQTSTLALIPIATQNQKEKPSQTSTKKIESRQIPTNTLGRQRPTATPIKTKEIPR
jgi:hypothetical protein